MKNNIFIKEYRSPNIYSQGHCFYEAAGVLETSELYLTPPIAVCLSFSIEMFLKCLKATQKYSDKIGRTYHKLYDETLVKPKGTGHDLVALFDELPKELTTEMSEQFNLAYHKELRDDLASIKSTFVDWRYIYEGKVNILHSSTLRRVADFLSEFSKEKIWEQ
ncbi:TPA: hypothetical protein KDZ68_003436 [Vibrio parahaemolyticus]|nr:hypothetical protein [Vibrio parahaemolyticus]